MTPLLRKKVGTAAKIALVVSFALSLVYAGNLAYQVAMYPVHIVQGRKAFKEGDYNRAIPHLRAVVRFFPSNSETRHMLGLAYIKSAEEQINAYPPDARRRERERLAAIVGSPKSETKTVPGDKPGPVAPRTNVAKP